MRKEVGAAQLQWSGRGTGGWWERQPSKGGQGGGWLRLRGWRSSVPEDPAATNVLCVSNKTLKGTGDTMTGPASLYSFTTQRNSSLSQINAKQFGRIEIREAHFYKKSNVARGSP